MIRKFVAFMGGLIPRQPIPRRTEGIDAGLLGPEGDGTDPGHSQQHHHQQDQPLHTTPCLADRGPTFQTPALSPTGTASFAARRIALVIEPGSALPVPAMS